MRGMRGEANFLPAEIDIEGEKPIQLRQLAEMLTKASEPLNVVKALRLAPALIEAAPDELQTLSSMLPTAFKPASSPDPITHRARPLEEGHAKAKHRGNSHEHDDGSTSQPFAPLGH